MDVATDRALASNDLRISISVCVCVGGRLLAFLYTEYIIDPTPPRDAHTQDWTVKHSPHLQLELATQALLVVPRGSPPPLHGPLWRPNAKAGTSTCRCRGCTGGDESTVSSLAYHWAGGYLPSFPAAAAGLLLSGLTLNACHLLCFFENI